MNVELEKLHAVVEFLITQETFRGAIEHLREQLNHSTEPFVWSVIDRRFIEREVPGPIRSGWIFALKKDVPSGCHFHPNSIQHMVTLNGQGMSKVASTYKKMVPFGTANEPLADIWLVIDKNVPHEFFPEKEDMVVISFHTCEANELEEVDCETGETRIYERKI